MTYFSFPSVHHECPLPHGDILAFIARPVEGDGILYPIFREDLSFFFTEQFFVSGPRRCKRCR